MEQVTKEDIKTCVPVNKMIEQANEKYIELYNKYRKILTKYLIKKLELKKYDELIENSGFNFKKVDVENQDIYQYFSSDLLNYIYIRNNIYIEKLTDEEKNELNSIPSNDDELSKLEEDFIERTYKKVIFEDVLGNNESCKVFYGPRTSSYMADNSYVIIGLRYDKYYNPYGNDEDWKNNYMIQSRFISKLLFKMQSEMCLKIDYPTIAIEYGDMSTIKLKKKETRVVKH